ncbi:MAG: S8 family serine peptidase [Candidatus Thiodiazotropha sp.]
MFREIVNSNSFKIFLTFVIVGNFAACGLPNDGLNDSENKVNGRLLAPSYAVIDGDVNDTETRVVPNHPATNAQTIPNPVNVGGYVNVAGAGRNGHSKTAGDPDDYYVADMAAGQTLLLTIGDIGNAGVDLDLYLYDSNGSLVDKSVGTSKYESLIVPTNGRYYIDVVAYSGASNYLLSVGLTPTSALPQDSLRLSSDFTPGDILVKFDQNMLQAKSDDTSLNHFTIQQSPNDATGISLLKLNDDFPSTAFRAESLNTLTEAQKLKNDTLMAIKELSRRDDVTHVQPNYIYKSFAVPNDQYYGYQWHYPLINLPQAWDITNGDSNVIVAVIDTGILSQHPDVPTQLVSGYDFISDVDRAGDGDGVDNNPEDVGDSITPGQISSFHGTHVAGTIAANTNNSIGVAGVASNVKIMPLRALGKEGQGSSLDIIQAIYYAAGLSNDYGVSPDRKADIINMSLGGSNPDPIYEQAIGAARNAGVIIIAAAGNDGKNLLSYPASYSGVVSVAAVDLNRQRATYSNYCSEVDVAAPGGDTTNDLNGDGKKDGVISTIGDDRKQGPILYAYNGYEGTSMATPHVAGVAALMKSVYPDLTPAEFDSMLSSGEITTDLGSPGRDDEYGHGLIDAYKAVRAAQQRGGGNTPVDPSLSVNPQSLNFSSNLQSITLYVEAVAGSLGNVQLSENIDWLSISPAQVDNSGYGSYSVNIDRSELSQGTYNGTITVTAGTSNVSVQVIMQVMDGVQTGNPGTHYVLLIDAITNIAVQQRQVDFTNGNSSFSFKEVSDGDYFVIAGSDMDLDNSICDSGESCGAYTTAANPTLINVDSGDVNDINFTVSFQSQTPSGSSHTADQPIEERQTYQRID